jgi:hypothetical protein
MFKKVLAALHAEIELPRRWWLGITKEKQAEYLECEAKDLTEFLHDHRSRDSYQIDIIREYKSLCEFCHSEEERDDDDIPVCCQKAIDEHELILVAPPHRKE